MRDTILIVDDEADIVSTLEDYFMYNDYNVITAANGKEAINKAGKQPDLILLDINMPDIDGLEVCSRIRDFVNCPILFLTARVEDSDKIKGFGLGGDDYLVLGGNAAEEKHPKYGLTINWQSTIQNDACTLMGKKSPLRKRNLIL